ncbi:MAG: Imm7 family immunity protein [Rhodothermales bacterium]
MFTCFGWANVCSNRDHIDPLSDDESEFEELAQKSDEQLYLELEKKIDAVAINSWIEITFHRQFNNAYGVLSLIGNHNHRYEPAIDLFRWIAEHGKGSHGLLFVLDDEDQHRGRDNSNCYKVWKLLRGEVQEIDDPFFSPYIPTVEGNPGKPL